MLSKMLVATAAVAMLAPLSFAGGRSGAHDRAANELVIHSPVARGITISRPLHVERPYALSGETGERKVVEYQMAGSRRLFPIVVRD